ncbi:hypothetical protein BBJ28_00007063 [Nothophytophthora sp. Chile5]|nr:hypothetical protein BBJ28_00007063 [Nothophytophthora sp. Chile5]
MYNGDRDRDSGSRRRKRSFDDDDRSGPKRSRYDDRRGPRDDRYGGSRGRGFASAESDRARSWRLAKKAVVELGDDVAAADVRPQLLRASALLVDELEADAQDVKLGHLAALVLRGSSRLAHKTALYAALVGLVNARAPRFGREVVAGAARSLQQDVAFLETESSRAEGESEDTDTLRHAGDAPAVALRLRLTVRLLAELCAAKVCKAEDVLALLDTMQGACTPDDWDVDGDALASLRTREDAAAWKDFFASVVLDALLHGGQALTSGCEELYESLLSRCREYVSNREEASSPRGSSDASASSWRTRRLQLELLWEPEQEDQLAALCAASDPLSLFWEALNVLRGVQTSSPSVDDPEDASAAGKWTVSGVGQPQELFAAELEKAELHPLAVALSIDLTTLDASKIPTYAAWFRVLSEDSGAAGAAIASLHPAAYLVARGHFACALETCHPKPAIAAKLLLGLSRSYNERFAPAKEQEQSAPVKSEYLLVETLLVAALGENSDAKLAYYCSVLYHLVKTDARVVSPALAVVVELLFREVPTMRAGSVNAFVLLFSHFLSNFEFKWRWAHWADVLEAPEDDPQRLFVSAVIERCVRLSYLQHMQSALPSEFHVLLPPAPKPRIRFAAAKTEDAVEAEAEDTSAASEFYQSVTTKLKGHPPASALHAWLDEELPRLEISRAEAVEVVWTCILEAGAATFTHMRLLLEKYGKRQELFGSADQPTDEAEADELVLVKTVGSVWLKSPQHIGLILNAMLRQGLLRPATIVTWVFTSDAVQQYSWPYVWEILNATLSFVQDAIRLKTKQLQQAASPKDSRDRDDEDMPDVATLEDARKRLQDELRQLLVQFFRGFNRVITEHKAACAADGADPRDNWFRSALAQLLSVGRRFRVPLEDALDELQLEVFSAANAADHDVTKVFLIVRDSYCSV